MKQTVIGLFSLFLIVACSNQNSDKNLQITGNIKGLKKGTLYLKKLEDTSLVLIDSIIIDGDSNFKSNIDIKSPEMLYLFLDRGTSNTLDNSLMFFAEPGKINITTDLEYYYANAKITGSKNQDLFDSYKKIKSRFNDEQLTNSEERMKMLKNNTTTALQKNQANYDAIIKRKYLYAINFAVTNNQYEIAPYIALSEINDATIKYLDTIQKSMSPKVSKSKYGIMLTKYIAERRKTE